MNATTERLGGAQKGTERVSIRPTVLIGLGGTGKEVLRRLRRMFYEKYREPGLPVMEYLWFDTDISNIDISKNRTDLLDRRIDFSASEKIDGSVRPQDLEAYRNNKGMYPHIWEWFPDDLDSLPSIAITQGAGQIRPCGRLAFFHHYNKLREEIERKVNRVLSAEAGAKMQQHPRFSEYDVDHNHLEIVLVTSIAGGTGSGSFIDMGFLCRDLFPDAVCTCTAYLVLPSVFDGVVGGARQTTRANGFAALKELEHYMQPHFDVQGTGDGQFSKHKFGWDGRAREVEAPPFSTVYLLDNRNFAGVRFEDHTDVFQMIAEFLLLDFEQTAFAMNKRSVRSNMEQFLQEVVTYKSDNYVQYFPCRYASFGLSQMEINQPRLANAASNKFAQYLVEFMIAAKNDVPSGFSEADVRPHLEQINLTTNQLIARALNRPGADFTLADHAINEILEPVFTDLKKRIRNATKAQDVAVLERQVDEAKSEIEGITREIQQKVAEKLSEAGTIKGEDIRQILDNVNRLRPELEDKVENHCIGMLCNPLDHGPNFVEKFLEHGREALESVRRELNQLANEQMESPKVPAIDIEFSEDFRRLKQRLKEAEDLTPLAWRIKKIALHYYGEEQKKAFHQGAKKTNDNLLNQVNTVQAELSDWVKKRFRKDAARFLVDLVERIIGLLGSRAEVTGDDGKISIKVSGLHAQIQSFRDNLQEMGNDFSDLHQAYIQRVTGERNLNLTPELDSYSEAIQDYLREDKNWSETDLPSLCKEGLERYFQEEAESLFVNRGKPQGETIEIIKEGTREIFKRSANRGRASNDWDDVRRTIDAYTFRLFEEFKNDLSATEALRGLGGQKEEIIRRSQRSAPRVSETRLTLPGLTDISDNRIGVMDQAWVDQVNRVAAPIKGDPYQATGHRPDAIVFVNQWMAFPILSIGNIVDLDREYRANTGTNASNVYRRHMIKNYFEFADILPPQDDGEVRALINAQSSLINGLIMGIVKYDDIQKGFYRPFTERGIKDLDRYGHNLERARLMIGNRPDAKRRLDIEIRKMGGQWRRENRDECFIQRLALKSWLLNEVFPSKMYVLGKEISSDHTFQILLDKSYQDDFDQTLKRFDLNEAELEAKLKKLGAEIDEFAERLPYRDRYCKDDIYVMK